VAVADAISGSVSPPIDQPEIGHDGKARDDPHFHREHQCQEDRPERQFAERKAEEHHSKGGEQRDDDLPHRNGQRHGKRDHQHVPDRITGLCRAAEKQGGPEDTEAGHVGDQRKPAPLDLPGTLRCPRHQQPDGRDEQQHAQHQHDMRQPVTLHGAYHWARIMGRVSWGAYHGESIIGRAPAGTVG
jgi:hypothetical protein